MRKAHPPSFAIDGVKFSNFLRECGLQPTVLSIGDVAFLFARNVASGSHYEMDFDGFVQALETIASLVYPPVPLKKKKKHANKRRQYCGGQQRNDDGKEAEEGFMVAPSSPLASLVFERLLFVPSMAVIWYKLIDSWRLEKKLELLTVYAREYCAATRIRAVWKQYMIKRIHLVTLLRMKAERHAATTIQSYERRRRQYAPFQRLRQATIHAQRRIHAHHQLRCLRAQRAAFVEAMRVRIVKWMQQQLHVLREWKKINVVWVARRE
uniref:EF-hand domain-containing protein n=1 Tax=Globisporangium ultimum (strain ATCC 200006 / CBS 805.95 / DAOM BR144) TaxID=431595 RepID=K3WKX1_GLOUD